jgi:hypothetical protein
MIGVKRQTMGKKALTFFAICILSTVFRFPPAAFADEYTFDTSETEKKPYHLGGYAEVKPVFYGLDRNAALYKPNFYGRNEGDTLAEYDGTLQLEGSLEKGISRLFVRTNTAYQNSYLGSSLNTTLYEGYLSLKPSPSLTIDAGKKTLKWGKGYAWNPAAFIDRPKDPNDPELNLEGFVVASADYIKSFDGQLKTLSFTPVVVPVYAQVNEDFGTTNNMNIAGKLYLLLYDTDIDFMALTGGSKSTRYGFDFSRNIVTNFEVHGEFAWINDFTANVIDSSGNMFQKTYDAKSYLLGLRYLTEIDTTYILEYYYNGTGLTDDEMKDYFSFVNTGYNSFLSSGDTTLLNRASSLTEGNYGKMNPMRDYLYLRISQKEPFDILYFTPAITGIVNTDDRSFSVSPELLYTRITNLEMRLKLMVLVGNRLTEFGEKQNDYRVELRARYYF